MEPQSVMIQPRMLKDFLQDQNLPFRPRKSAISVFLHTAVSSVLRRSISRRLSNKNKSSSRKAEPVMQRSTSLTVKDILRWKSFRDLQDPVVVNAPTLSESTPESPPYMYTATATATATTTTTTSAGSPRSSWCDSDFTVGDSPVWFRGFSGEKGFHINVVGGERKTGDLKDRSVLVDDDEQFSPISVLDFTQEHEETFSPFHQTFADIERRSFTLKQRIQDFEHLVQVDDVSKRVESIDTESFKIEEHAIQLLDQVKTTRCIEEWDLGLDCLLLDFFRDELITNKEVKNNGKLDSRLLNVAKSWVRGEDDGSFEWRTEDTSEACVREMDGRWNSKDFFEDEKSDIVIEIEKIMLNHLLDELSVDLVNV